MMRNTPGIVIGSILVVVGILLLLDNLGIIDVSEALAHLWPLILVLIGLALLIKGRKLSSTTISTAKQESVSASARGIKAETSTIIRTEIFGDILLQVSSQEFSGGSLNTIFGDIRLDLRNAHLKEGEQHLRVSTVFGDTKIEIPEGMELSLEASTVLGSIKVKGEKRSGFAPSILFKTAGYDAASRKLHIVASQIFGDVKVY